jgi:hypothetical protein
VFSKGTLPHSTGAHGAVINKVVFFTKSGAVGVAEDKVKFMYGTTGGLEQIKSKVLSQATCY